MLSDDSNNRRRFTEAERRAVFIAANGLCEICGAELGGDFHVDHIKPYSAGGPTTTGNAQAACPACNLAKGARFNVQTMPTREGREPRAWQQEAFEAVMRTSQRSALIQATPGAGKTGLACGVARALMDVGRITRVLVVSPLTTLQEDWARDMSAIGIEIDPDSAGGKFEATDYQGRSLTYSALSFVEGRSGGAQIEQIAQGRTRTLVILDEVHHASDKASWGVGLKQACGNASFVLCLSGTPFRTDGNPIPFVVYDNDGNAVADFIYSYSSAIIDKVCRPVFFPAYEGSLEWLSHNEFYQSKFSDDLDEEQQSRRLRTALQSDDFVLTQLVDANDRLKEIRSSHPSAGGLIVAMDQSHARYLADLMTKVSYSKPVLVLSDDKRADDRLREFRSGVEPWIIAVRKVSEGVDVPRLRVCVYMSNVITEMFFRQVVGRVVRYTPGIQQQEAFVYIPADQRLVEMAMRIQEERLEAALNMKDGDDDESANDEGEGEGSLFDDLSRESDFRVLNGYSWHESTITYNGQAFALQEIEAAKPRAAQYGVRPEIMALMMRDGAWRDGANGHCHQSPTGTEPALFERKRKLKSSPKGKSLKAEVRNRFLWHIQNDDQAFRFLGMAINRAIGKRSGEERTEEQHRKEIEMLESAMKSREVPSWLK